MRAAGGAALAGHLLVLHACAGLLLLLVDLLDLTGVEESLELGVVAFPDIDQLAAFGEFVEDHLLDFSVGLAFGCGAGFNALLHGMILFLHGKKIVLVVLEDGGELCGGGVVESKLFDKPCALGVNDLLP